MGNVDADRIWNEESAHTWRSNNFADFLNELDARIAGADCYINITRSANLISQIDYYSDAARTDRAAKKVLTRTSGKITGVTTTYYNKDGTEDSTVTSTLTRDVQGRITGCDNVFATTESYC